LQEEAAPPSRRNGRLSFALPDLVTLPDRRLKVAFFGTPDIAGVHLQRLIDEDTDDVALVISQPDRPKGRGRTLEPTPTKTVAEAAGVEVVQPRKLRDGVLAGRLRREGFDLAIVVAYGRILPVDLYEAPAFDTWNVHASLLPRHRGAAPIQHAILEGDAETGVTLMLLSEAMDEGDMLLRKATPVGPEETSGELFERLAGFGAETLVEGLRLAKAEGLVRTVQDPAAATYAPMLRKADGRLDLTQSAEPLARRVRGLHPWPGAFLEGPQGPIKVHRARAVPIAGDARPGTIVQAGPDRLVIAAGAGGLELLELQLPGKKALSAADYLRGAGRSLRPGDSLVSATD
jgi:methionyl-tRNA formyltransferase